MGKKYPNPADILIPKKREIPSKVLFEAVAGLLAFFFAHGAFIAHYLLSFGKLLAVPGINEVNN